MDGVRAGNWEGRVTFTEEGRTLSSFTPSAPPSPYKQARVDLDPSQPVVTAKGEPRTRVYLACNEW